MAIYEIRDLEDITTAVIEELGIDPNDEVEKRRIKRDVNSIYLHEVVPFKRWLWLAGFIQKEHKGYFNTGTVSVTLDSTTATLTNAPNTSKVNFFFAVEGYEEIYKVAAHTATTTTITLSSPYTGTTTATATFRIWTDEIGLPTNCKETVTVFHAFDKRPLEAKGLQKFLKEQGEQPRAELRPQCYTTYDYFDPSTDDEETESDRYRVLRVHPAQYLTSTTLNIQYVKEATPLELDGDEPLLPMEDRMVLVYGARARAWRRKRNPEESASNEQLFRAKLDRMASKIEDGFDSPRVAMDSKYITSKRGQVGRTKGYYDPRKW